MFEYEHIVRTYAAILADKVANDPAYDWPNKSAAEVDRVARNMLLNVLNGQASISANKSILATMRKLGVKTTGEFKDILRAVTPAGTVRLERTTPITVYSNLGPVQI